MTTTLLKGDCRDILKTLPDQSVHCCVTSPPYFGLRDYGHAGQIGLEATPDAFVAEMVAVFREVRRVLRDDGTLWLNLGDSYNAYNGGAGPSSQLSRGAQTTQRPQLASGYGLKFKGLKPKDLIGIPWRVAFALQADGWYLRQDIIWSKPNPMPESVTDRCTKAHEYIFLMSKSARYHYDAESIKETATKSPMTMQPSPEAAALKSLGPMARGNGINHQFADPERLWAADGKRNKRSVWEVSTQPFSEAHFATFPPDLIEPCIKAGTSEKGCCAKCGSPWIRQTEQTRTNQSGSGRAGNPPAGKGGPNAQHSGTMNDIRMGPTISTQTVGWSASCSCNAAVIPCTVLDPFGGAGTTGLVADRLGRNATLIELNPEYATLAERRIRNDAGLFAQMEVVA